MAFIGWVLAIVFFTLWRAERASYKVWRAIAEHYQKRQL
jgi:hypothetical protein